MIICAKYLMTGDGKTVLEDKAVLTKDGKIEKETLPKEFDRKIVSVKCEKWEVPKPVPEPEPVPEVPVEEPEPETPTYGAPPKDEY